MKSIIFATLMFLTAAANATDTTIINTFESNDGETYDAFVVRVATDLDNWTRVNGVEACGSFTRNEERYFVIIGTNWSQLSCADRYIVNGTKAIGENIHSHPHSESGFILVNERTRRIEQTGLRGFQRVAVDRFSKQDYHNGTGYLVTNGTLMHQNGVRTAKVVANLTSYIGYVND